MSDDTKQTWHLWRGATPYTLLVFPPTRSSRWVVDIHKGHVDVADTATWLNTVLLDRGTHIVGDCYDVAEQALGERKEE
jgi:hypothetical protein